MLQTSQRIVAIAISEEEKEKAVSLVKKIAITLLRFNRSLRVSVMDVLIPRKKIPTNWYKAYHLEFMGQLSNCPYIIALCIYFLIHKCYNESNKFEFAGELNGQKCYSQIVYIIFRKNIFG